MRQRPEHLRDRSVRRLSGVGHVQADALHGRDELLADIVRLGRGQRFGGWGSGGSGELQTDEG